LPQAKAQNKSTKMRGKYRTISEIDEKFVSFGFHHAVGITDEKYYWKVFRGWADLSLIVINTQCLNYFKRN